MNNSKKIIKMFFFINKNQKFEKKLLLRLYKNVYILIYMLYNNFLKKTNGNIYYYII